MGTASYPRRGRPQTLSSWTVPSEPGETLVTCRFRSWNSRDVSREALSGAVLQRAPVPPLTGRASSPECASEIDRASSACRSALRGPQGAPGATWLAGATCWPRRGLARRRSTTHGVAVGVWGWLGNGRNDGYRLVEVRGPLWARHRSGSDGSTVAVCLINGR